MKSTKTLAAQFDPDTTRDRAPARLAVGLRRVCLAASAALLFSSGCASSTQNLEQESMKTASRVDELERANRQLQVRLDAYEASLTLVEDQVYAVQLAGAQRAARTSELDVVRVAPSDPYAADPYAPRVQAEPYVEAYAASPHAADTYAEPSPDDGEYIDIVVSDEKLERYFGGAQGPAPATTSGGGATPVAKRSNGRTPQPSVVAGDSLSVAPMRKDGSGVLASKDPIDLYKAGLKHYRQEQFQPAIELFENFLAASPPDDYVDNALYWLGECHYGLANYTDAATYFHRIVKEYPNANKVPDALLKVGLTYIRLGKRDSAAEVMYYLIEAYPDTEAARVARDRLDKLNAS